MGEHLVPSTAPFRWIPGMNPDPHLTQLIIAQLLASGKLFI